jgi:hypothetical protein
MKTRKITFKVKHSNGVHFSHPDFQTRNAYEYIGKSRIDGFPIYSLEYPEYAVFSFFSICRHFIFNGKPHYTPVPEDFEFISSLEEELSNPGLTEICPLDPPSCILYNSDYKYKYDESDERLLLIPH